MAGTKNYWKFIFEMRAQFAKIFFTLELRRAVREAEGARLLSVYTPKGYLGFKSPALRHAFLFFLNSCLKLFIRRFSKRLEKHEITVTMFLIRLTRIVPFVIFLAVLAVIIYLIARFRFPSARAKQIVIDFFTAICVVLCVALGFITLLTVLDSNAFAVEIFGSFLAAAVLGLIAVRICNWRFLKKYPQYKRKPNETFIYSTWHKIKEFLRNMTNNQPPIR